MSACIYIYIYIYVCVCVCVCVCACVRACVRACMHVYTHMCIHVCVQVGDIHVLSNRIQLRDRPTSTFWPHLLSAMPFSLGKQGFSCFR